MTKLKQYKMFIDGEWVNSESKKTFETLNPENNKPWAVVPEASASDVDRAVKAAQKAFEGEWPKLLPRERGKYLRAIGNKLRENAKLLGEIETIDTGKIYRETNKQANYIEENYEEIENDMNTRNSTSRPKDSTASNSKTRKKREELSVSASKSIKKEEVEIMLTFN